MDFLFNRLSERAQAYVDLFTYVLILALIGLIAWRGAELVSIAYTLGLRTRSGLWTLYIPYMAIPIGMGIFCLACLLRLKEDLNTIFRITKGQRSNT